MIVVDSLMLAGSPRDHEIAPKMLKEIQFGRPNFHELRVRA